MKEKLIRFMQGRYGSDEFSRFLLGAMIVLWLLSIIFQRAGEHLFVLYMLSVVFNYLALAIIVYCWFRMFSKNIPKRYAENQAYLRYKNIFLRNMKVRKTDRDHKIFTCPNCSQKIRVPRKKGKIAIRCPKCGTEFIKRT